MQTTLSWKSRHAVGLDSFVPRLDIGDEEWREKIAVLDELLLFATTNAANITAESLNSLVGPFRSMFCELRSTVVKKACDVFCELTLLYRQRAKVLVEKVFSSLLEARGGSNKVNSQAIHFCTESILHLVVSKNALKSILFTFKHTKNGQVRDSCIQYLFIVLMNWPTNVLEPLKTPIQECIISSLSDASPLCREVARSCYGQFISMWPEKKAELQSKLSPNVIKYLAALKLVDSQDLENNQRRKALNDISNTEQPTSKKRRYQNGRASDKMFDAVDKCTCKARFESLELKLKERDHTIVVMSKEIEALKTVLADNQLQIGSYQNRSEMLEVMLKTGEENKAKYLMDTAASMRNLEDENCRLKNHLVAAKNELDFLNKQTSLFASTNHNRSRSYSADEASMYSQSNLGSTSLVNSSLPTFKLVEISIPTSSRKKSPEAEDGKLECSCKHHEETDILNLRATNAKLNEEVLELNIMRQRMGTLLVENDRLQDQVKSLMSEIEALEKDLQKNNDSKNVEHTSMDHQKRVEEVANQVKQLTEKLEAAEEQNGLLKMELETLALKEIETAQQIFTQKSEWESKVESLTQKCLHLEDEMQNLSTAKTDLKLEMETQLAKKEHSLEKVKTENLMLQAKVESLLKANEELQSCIKVTEDAYYQMRQDVSSQSLEEVECMPALKAENEVLHSRIENLLLQNQSCDAKCKALHVSLDKASCEVEELTREIGDLKSDIRACELQKETLKLQIAAAEDKTSRVYHDFSSQLLEKTDELSSSRADNNSMHSQIQALLQRIDELESCVKVTEDAYYQMRQDISSQSMEEVASVVPVKAENESLQTRVQDLLQQLQNLEISNEQLCNEVICLRNMQQKYLSLEDEILTLSQKLGEAERKMRTVVEENAQLRSDLCCQSLLDAEATDKLQNENDRLESEVKLLRDKITSLEQLINGEEEKSHRLQLAVEELTNVRDENDRLNIKIESLMEQLTIRQTSDQASDEALSQLREELMMLSAREAEARAESSMMRTREESHLKTLETLETRLQVLEKHNSDLQNEIRAQSLKEIESRAKLKFENQCLHTQMESLQQQLNSLNCQNLDDMNISMQDEMHIDLTQRETVLESPMNPSKPEIDRGISPSFEESKANLHSDPKPSFTGSSKWGQHLFAFREKGNLKAQRQLNDANILKRWKPSP
ncbi:hypothetical protein AC1031_000058 [Aphanomyces cochlioides]|nr:hypothetical protein AC1031_000058 [Aphanomyces cochlioides]